MAANHWEKLFGTWAKLPVPRRISSEVVDRVRDLVTAANGPVLLLGVTHGLSEIDCDLTSLDRSEGLFRAQWPGNTSSRRAIVGDWFNPPFANETFTTCVGDGILTPLRYPDEIQALLDVVLALLRPNGRFICRVFASPAVPESVDAVARAAWNNSIRRFQSLKFRLGMAVAAENGGPNASLETIHTAFEAAFPNRDELAAVTGWSRAEIDTIDLYAGSPSTYSFPTVDQLVEMTRQVFGSVTLESTAPYEMSDRYPIIVATKTKR